MNEMGYIMKKTLCLYYTRTNTTKAVMEQLAEILGADIAEYTDGKDRSGFLGYISCCFAKADRLKPGIFIKGGAKPEDYERVIIGMPVWAEGPCAVGRAFLAKYRDVLPKDVCFVVTHSGKNDYDKKIAQLDQYLASPQTAHISIRTKENDSIRDQVQAFAEKIR